MSPSHNSDQSRPRAQLETEFGTLELTAFDADCVTVATPRPDGYITVNRVQVDLHSTLHRAETGEWQWKDRDHIGASRHDGTGYGDSFHGLSYNAHDKLCDTIPVAVSQWADAHPDLLRAGALAARADQRRAVLAELDQVIEQAGNLRAEIERIDTEIATLKAATE